LHWIIFLLLFYFIIFIILLIMNYMVKCNVGNKEPGKYQEFPVPRDR